MKSLKNVFCAVALFAMFFVGCDKIKDAADVEVESTYNADLNGVVPPGSREITGSFSANAEIDISDDPNFSKYLTNIKRFEILSLTGTITAISKDVTLETADLGLIAKIDGYMFDTTCVIINLPITLGTSFDFPIEIKLIEDGLPEGDYLIHLATTGTTDKDDVNFTIGVAIKTKFVANPL